MRRSFKVSSHFSFNPNAHAYSYERLFFTLGEGNTLPGLYEIYSSSDTIFIDF